MIKKQIAAIYPGLPTDIKEVEILLHEKLDARKLAHEMWVVASTQMDNLDREIKHLKRQAGFILGTEEPAPGEEERILERKKRKAKEDKANK